MKKEVTFALLACVSSASAETYSSTGLIYGRSAQYVGDDRCQTEESRHERILAQASFDAATEAKISTMGPTQIDVYNSANIEAMKRDTDGTYHLRIAEQIEKQKCVTKDAKN